MCGGQRIAIRMKVVATTERSPGSVPTWNTKVSGLIDYLYQPRKLHAETWLKNDGTPGIPASLHHEHLGAGKRRETRPGLEPGFGVLSSSLGSAIPLHLSRVEIEKLEVAKFQHCSSLARQWPVRPPFPLLHSRPNRLFKQV